jgi:hypothetical protein
MITLRGLSALFSCAACYIAIFACLSLGYADLLMEIQAYAIINEAISRIRNREVQTAWVLASAAE